MKTFACVCGNPIYFENTLCYVCGRMQGFAPDRSAMIAFEPAADGQWRPADPPLADAPYRKCANYECEDVCNWMVPADDPAPFCHACRLNKVIPDLTMPENRPLWFRIEQAKRRVIYTLDRLGLPVFGKEVDFARGLGFEFLRDMENDSDEFYNTGFSQQTVMTGHRTGVITINIAEADPGARERMRETMGEGYRTLLGHFRHEIAHYYWDLLVRDSRWIEPVRALFGDERGDYAAALAAHYQNGAAPGWPARHISAYASSHPWEDWAETWAHYLHMTDTLETARDRDVAIDGRRIAEMPPGSLAGRAPLLDWAALTTALNALNRSMGHPDAYPFGIAPLVADKLKLIDDIIASSQRVVDPTRSPSRTVATPPAPA